jgi:tRNA uridine 5-carbamoylmethylation protein Kti12
MNLSGNKGRLAGLTKEIFLRWDETKNHWRDAKSGEFEQRHMTELAANVDRTLIILDKLEAVLKKVRSDCE